LVIYNCPWGKVFQQVGEQGKSGVGESQIRGVWGVEGKKLSSKEKEDKGTGRSK